MTERLGLLSMHPVFVELKQLQNRWSLPTEKMAALCHVPEALYLEWVHPESSIAQREMPSQPAGAESAVRLLAIARKLAVTYPDPLHQVAWLTRPNSHFDQNCPMDIALSSSENLAWIAYVLESAASAAESATI